MTNASIPQTKARQAEARQAEARKIQTQKIQASRMPAPVVRPVCDGGYGIDADFVIYRLEEAGATLLALPGTGWSTRLRTSSLDIVRSALESYGWSEARGAPADPLG